MKIAKTIILGSGLILAISGCGPIIQPFTPATKTPVAAQSSTPQQKTTETTNTYKDFKWVGLEDKVDNKLEVIDYNNGLSKATHVPDGIPDGHFKITLNLIEPIAISNISLTNTEFGKTVEWSWYPGYTPGTVHLGGDMAVYDNGQSDIQEKLSGTHTLDIYAQGFKEFSFDSGKEFTLKILFATKESKYADKVFNAIIKI